MKILEVLLTLQSGGAERFVVDLSNELARNGHEVTLAPLRDIEANPDHAFYAGLLDERVKLQSCKVRYPGLMAYFKLRKLLKTVKPDVVHLHLNTIPYFFPMALIKGDTQFFHTIHNIAETTIGYPGQKPFNHFYYRTGRIKPVTISDFCNRSYQKVYDLPLADCVYNGREEVQFSDKLPQVQTEIDQLKRHPDDRVFVLVATICDRKNQMLAAKVFQRLQSEDQHVTLLLIGKATEPEYLQQLQAQMPDNVVYLGEKSNVPDYLQCADGFMLSSRYEGNPISILEALSCGCVPICTAVGGIVDVITEGETGYLANEVSEESLYNAVKRYLAAPDKIAPETLKKYYADNHTMKICAEKYAELFNRYRKENHV